MRLFSPVAIAYILCEIGPFLKSAHISCWHLYYKHEAQGHKVPKCGVLINYHIPSMGVISDLFVICEKCKQILIAFLPN